MCRYASRRYLSNRGHIRDGIVHKLVPHYRFSHHRQLEAIDHVVFSSPSFIFLFLPLFFASYCLVPPRARNAIIFIGSVGFYFTGAGHVAVVLILSVPLNQYLGRYIFRHVGTRKGTVALVVGVLANLLPLLLYKYLGFFTRSLNDV